jgi:hypothetical protein
LQIVKFDVEKQELNFAVNNEKEKRRAIEVILGEKEETY